MTSRRRSSVRDEDQKKENLRAVLLLTGMITYFLGRRLISRLRYTVDEQSTKAINDVVQIKGDINS